MVSGYFASHGRDVGLGPLPVMGVLILPGGYKNLKKLSTRTMARIVRSRKGKAEKASEEGGKGARRRKRKQRKVNGSGRHPGDCGNIMD
jgi:hypothetical protein